MRRTRAWSALLPGLALGAACSFAPDYSAYERCDEQGACPRGFGCYAPQNLCLPECGERPVEECAFEPDSGLLELDAGGDDVDAGQEDPDSGTQEDPDGGLALLNTALPPGVEGDPYLHVFEASGGLPPYTFVAPAGVPPGLSFDSGTLSGAPQTPSVEVGGDTFSVELYDSDGGFDSAQVQLEVARRLRIASGGVDDGGVQLLTDAESGSAYSEQLHATGHTTGTLSWSIDGGALPNGLSLSPSGELQGTTSSGGTFTVVLQSDGAPPQTRARTLRIVLNTLGVTLHVRTESLPLGRVGEPYSYRLRSAGGGSTHTWSHLSGTLPLGVQLDGVNHQLNGTPTAAGDFSFALRVSDGLASQQRAFVVRIDP